MTPNSSHVWLVTGAASGIGAAVVRTVADAGCSVFALDIDDEAGKALEGAHYRHLDVASENDWQALADYHPPRGRNCRRPGPHTGCFGPDADLP